MCVCVCVCVCVRVCVDFVSSIVKVSPPISRGHTIRTPLCNIPSVINQCMPNNGRLAKVNFMSSSLR